MDNDKKQGNNMNLSFNDKEEEEEDKKEIMFRNGDRVRIAHYPGIDSSEDPFLRQEHIVGNEVGCFGHIVGIFVEGYQHGPYFASIKEASERFQFTIKFETNSFDNLPIHSEDVVNYSLLGDEIGDACFEATRSKECPSTKDVIDKTKSIFSTEFIENLEKVNLCRRRFLFERDMNRMMRNKIHKIAVDNKKQSDT